MSSEGAGQESLAQAQDRKGLERGAWREERRLSGGQVNP